MSKNLLALGMAAIGGLIGYWVFFFIAEQGFYGLILPGALLGLGAGLVKNNSWFVAVVCGFAAVALGLFTEYRFMPFEKDKSLGFFLAHVHQLKPLTLIMIAIGGLLGFYVPFRQRETAGKV